MILSAFPIVAVFSAFKGKPVLERRRGKLAVGALALAVSLLFTAVYHLGYSDFRGEKLRKPLAGDAIWSVPTLVTLTLSPRRSRTRGCTSTRSSTATTRTRSCHHTGRRPPPPGPSCRRSWTP